jgi:hypothetical protein
MGIVIAVGWLILDWISRSRARLCSSPCPRKFRRSWTVVTLAQCRHVEAFVVTVMTLVNRNL